MFFVLAYKNVLFYVNLINLIYNNFRSNKIKLPEGGAEAPKHVGAFVI